MILVLLPLVTVIVWTLNSTTMVILSAVYGILFSAYTIWSFVDATLRKKQAERQLIVQVNGCKECYNYLAGNPLHLPMDSYIPRIHQQHLEQTRQRTGEVSIGRQLTVEWRARREYPNDNHPTAKLLQSRD